MHLLLFQCDVLFRVVDEQMLRGYVISSSILSTVRICREVQDQQDRANQPNRLKEVKERELEKPALGYVGARFEFSW